MCLSIPSHPISPVSSFLRFASVVKFYLHSAHSLSHCRQLCILNSLSSVDYICDKSCNYKLHLGLRYSKITLLYTCGFKDFCNNLSDVYEVSLIQSSTKTPQSMLHERQPTHTDTSLQTSAKTLTMVSTSSMTHCVTYTQVLVRLTSFHFLDKTTSNVVHGYNLLGEHFSMINNIHVPQYLFLRPKFNDLYSKHYF